MPAVSASRPFDIQDATTGHGTDWTEHTFPTWVRVIGVQNRGTGTLRVAHSRTGAASGGVELAAGELVSFGVTPGRGLDPTGAPSLVVQGADGASHALTFVCQENPA